MTPGAVFRLGWGTTERGRRTHGTGRLFSPDLSPQGWRFLCLACPTNLRVPESGGLD